MREDVRGHERRSESEQEVRECLALRGPARLSCMVGCISSMGVSDMLYMCIRLHGPYEYIGPSHSYEYIGPSHLRLSCWIQQARSCTRHYARGQYTRHYARGHHQGGALTAI